MGLLDRLRNELIDIIEWTEPAHSDILAYRFPRYANEIKMGAKLVVREGQTAVFVNEGQLADVFRPGTYTLQTENMPILATLRGWKYGFHSPFKAEVYFISMRQWTDLKWGTANPIMMRDPEFGPVRVRAFGTYAMHVSDPATFLRQIVTTDPNFETYEITNQLRNAIVSRFADAIGQAKIAVLDLAGNYDKIATVARQQIAPELAAMGLELTAFYVENISLPAEVEQALDKRTQMGVIGNLQQYTQFQTANAIPTAAANPGGIAGIGAGLGAGMAIAGQMAGAMQGAQQTAQAPGGPPPVPGANVSFYLAIDGKQAGPFDLATLANRVREGGLTRQTLVWKQGMSGWTAAEQVPELQAVLAQVPPPLPQ
ncbi:MAG TPA: SPFH domain-containing protein [Gemmataceae bacterium]|nr:SPFH domain-containing protein [Gemmataceae bacterium]